MPVLNEAPAIGMVLDALQPLRAHGLELVVSDGGSDDGSQTLAARRVDRLVQAPRGRARQMNAGAAVARGEVLLFLHADTHLTAGHVQAVQEAMCQAGAVWGRFDVSLAGASRLLPVIAFCMNLRSCLTGIATGDQALFVRREVFDALGGFADIELMEDIELSVRLRRHAWPRCLHRPRLVTSGRRWDRHGVLRTVLLMWGLRAAYALGASPGRLRTFYRDHCA